MSNSNAFLAVVLDGASLETLHAAAQALNAAPAELLGMSPGAGFDPVDRASLHMTFLFFGEYLRALPAAELCAVHEAMQARVGTAVDAGGVADMAAASLRFTGFELFPPEKLNLVVARYEASAPLVRLRSSILAACKEVGISFPASYFALIAGEGAWAPHVTLGKIRAPKAEIGKATCTGSRLRALAPVGPLQPRGLTLLGERPARAKCDWDGALDFGLAATGDDTDSDVDGVVEADVVEAAQPDMVAWAAELLLNPDRLDEAAQSKFQELDTKGNASLERTECVAFASDFAKSLGTPAPSEAKVHAAFAMCAKSSPAALTQAEFARFFKGFLRSSLEHLQQQVEAHA